MKNELKKMKWNSNVKLMHLSFGLKNNIILIKWFKS